MRYPSSSCVSLPVQCLDSKTLQHMRVVNVQVGYRLPHHRTKVAALIHPAQHQLATRLASLCLGSVSHNACVGTGVCCGLMECHSTSTGSTSRYIPMWQCRYMCMCRTRRCTWCVWRPRAGATHCCAPAAALGLQKLKSAACSRQSCPQDHTETSLTLHLVPRHRRPATGSQSCTHTLRLPIHCRQQHTHISVVRQQQTSVCVDPSTTCLTCCISRLAPQHNQCKPCHAIPMLCYAMQPHKAEQKHLALLKQCTN